MFVYWCSMCGTTHSTEGVQTPSDMVELKKRKGPAVEVIFACRTPCNAAKLEEFTKDGWELSDPQA